MQGKLSWLRTSCSAANPETIHTCCSSVYGVLKLEVTFYTCTMTEETREFETDSFVCGYHVYHVCQYWLLENSWFVRGKREI